MRRFFRKFDKSLIIFAILIFSLLFVASFHLFSNAFAGNREENGVVEAVEAFHVTIFDDEKRLTVKTNARTVAEVLERAEVILGDFDSVEPSLDSEINADNFFINIHRAHPALVIDGAAKKFLMTPSFNPKSVAAEAGFSLFDGDSIALKENYQFLELGIATVYEITRGGGSTLTVEEEIPFPEETVKDFSLGSGKTEVIQLGEVGSKTLVYSVKTQNGLEISRELLSETVTRDPVARIVHVGVDPVEMNPLTASMGRNRYTATSLSGLLVERQETYYDLDMSKVMQNARNTGGVWANCNHSGNYSVREDGAKVDDDGYVLVAAELSRYPRCSVVQTSLGLGKVYDTGTFALSNPEQFDLATDWTRKDGI